MKSAKIGPLKSFPLYSSVLAKAWYHGAPPRYALGYIALARMCRYYMPVGVVILCRINESGSTRNATWHFNHRAQASKMAVAHRKRARSSSTTGTSTLRKHKIGYTTSWTTDFPVFDDSETTVVGLVKLETLNSDCLQYKHH